MKKLIRIIPILMCLILITACYQQIIPFPFPGFNPDKNQDTETEQEPGTVTKVESIEIVNGSATVSVDTSPVGKNDSTANYTTVSIPESVVGNASTVRLTVTPYDIENANHIISASDKVVGAINISMELDSREVNEFGEAVTITTHVAKGLANVEVRYNGSGADPTSVNYDEDTGKIIFKTSHFSIFYVVADPVVAYIPETNTAYETLSDAIDEAPSGSTIVMLKDATGAGLRSDDKTKTRESLIIDFAGHTYTMTDPAVGSPGTETQAMHWGTSLGAVTMKNGTFQIEEDTVRVSMAMQNYISFTAEDMTFDFSNIPVARYGDNEFDVGSEFEKYNGLEVPMFNNNRDGEMLLKSCRVIMPSESTKGISAGGKFVRLEDTTVDGYICLLDDTCELIVAGSTQFDDVVSYFEGGRVTNTTTDEGTIYQLATE